MTIRTTEANGHEIDDYSHMASTMARRFAADAPRAHDAIKRIETSAGERGVCVELSNDFDADCLSLPVPDGWEVDHFNVVSDGSAYVYINRVDA
jgi:hypothetical protein